MAFKVRLTELAQEDVDGTTAFFVTEQSSLEEADRWLRQIEAAIERLQDHPLAIPRIPEETSDRTVRHLVVKSHRVLFEVDEISATVTILRVWHAARSNLTLPTQDL